MVAARAQGGEAALKGNIFFFFDLFHLFAASFPVKG